MADYKKTNYSKVQVVNDNKVITYNRLPLI